MSNRWWIAGFLALAASGAASAQTAYKVSDRIPGPDGGWDYVRVDPINNRVYVARGVSAMAVDLKTKAVTAGLSPGQGLHDALPVNRGAEVLVTHGGTDTIEFINAKTGAVVATLPMSGKNPDAASFDAKSGLVLVMDHTGGDVVVVDPKAHTVLGSIPVGGQLEGAAFDGAGKAYVNVEDKNEIAVIDIAGRKVLSRYPLTGCNAPTGIVYDAADHLLISSCDGSTAVTDPKTGQVVQILPTGKGADGVAFDAKRKRAFVSAGRDGNLSVIQFTGGKGAIVQTLPTKVSARTIGLDPRTGYLYLPSATMGPPATPGGRPAPTPGSFELLVVSP